MVSRPVSLRARLAQAGLDPDRVLDDLTSSGLLDDEDQADRLLALLSEAAEPNDAADVLVRLARDPARLGPVLDDQAWLTRVVAVAGASRPLGELIARYDDALESLHTLDVVDRDAVERACKAAVLESDDLDRQAAGLAAVRRAATADIAARDLTGTATLDEVGAELSRLAEGVLTGTLAGIRARFAAEHRSDVRVAVIGMGKLGGHELNYVSDIDVIFVHEPIDDQDDHASQHVRGVLTRLLELLNASTTMGRVYEIDPTLRPEGTSGALSRTVDSYVAYWERWARTWEFQAMLKARPVAGDLDLGRQLMERAEPFVWPERLESGVVAEIREMKSRIESKPEVVRHGERQIKLGPGGIRDIEFAVQLLQLVHGRADRSLRCTGTLPTLEALVANGYVDEDDAEPFAAAYRLLRTVEHRLQLAHERRTHTVPEDPARQEWLARSLGYRAGPDGPAREAMLRELSTTQARVRELHAKLFYRPLLEAYAVVPAETGEVSVPGQVTAMGDEAARERLEALGFRDGQAALRHVRGLTGGLSRRSRTVRAVLPAMLQVLQDTPDPDAGLASFRELVESANAAEKLMTWLRDNPASVELVGRVLGTSVVAGELLVGQPRGIEWLRDDTLRDTPRTREELVRMALARMHWQDTTAALRRLKRSELLRLVLRDLSGGVTVGVVGEELSALADACLVGALHAELASRVEALGLAGPQDLGLRFAIIGMGKLGGRELNYASDLDVLFVHEVVEGADEEQSNRLALEIAGNVMRSLSTITAEGSAFDIDADLRPEGRNGALSRTLTSYRAYWERWAEPWEHQALLRARRVAGDDDLGRRFVEEAATFAYPTEDTAGPMRRMKARIEKERIPRRVPAERHLKLGPGGLSDVEWTVQMLQQRHHDVPVVRTPSTMAAIDALQDADLMRHADADWLRDGHRFASQVRNRLYLLRHRDVDVLPTSSTALEVLARSLGYPRGDWQQLEEDWRRHSRHVRRVCEQLFYGIDPDTREGTW
ncbi:MAG: bifunctional [glutamine synthetase] adenylyltransferase/[glutamine synthetase]-adenylyl-L-tyrosine phosphorylase [Nitriliruptoraceae bacterium]